MRRRALLILALATAVALTTAATAYATFTNAASASQPVATDTLQPPTGVTAALTSQCNRNKTQQVTINWTASGSAFATGYTVQRNGMTVATVASTASSYVDVNVPHTTTNTYTVLATYQQWSSGASAPAVTTC